jgi:hypothetical protein
MAFSHDIGQNTMMQKSRVGNRTIDEEAEQYD